MAHRAAGLGGRACAWPKTRTVVLGSGRTSCPAPRTRRRDEKLRKARKEKKVAAILHDSYPVRFWDHDLGPESPHLFVATGTATRSSRPLASSTDPRLRALTGRDAGGTVGARGAGLQDISPDGRTVVTGWSVRAGARREQRNRLVAIDAASGERRVLRR